MSRPGRPTLADVAAQAGVSLKTASRALNGEYGVAAGTAERVESAAAAGSATAPTTWPGRSPPGRPVPPSGLVIPTVSDPFFAAMAAEAEATLAPRRLGSSRPATATTWRASRCSPTPSSSGGSTR